MVLDDLQPRAVLKFFEQLCSFPHGSGNTKEISDFCVNFAKARGLEHYQDTLNNVIIIKPATKGYEGADPVIIQGHLDMVCEKEPTCDKDMLTEGINIQVSGDIISARGTTLGGDDGVAIAIALALLDADNIPHPRLEAVFTTDEETGMSGARGLDVTPLTARTMLNIDSEAEGVLTVSCAGGARASCKLAVSRGEISALVAEISVGGLAGGHSGEEIDKGRGNSNILMGRILNALAEVTALRLVSLYGGSADNAIPAETKAVVAVEAQALDILLAVCEKYDGVFKREFSISDACVAVSANVRGEETVYAVERGDTRRIIDALVMLPNGIQEMSMAIPGLPETSLNLGILRLEGGAFSACFSVRSSVSPRMEMMKIRLSRIMCSLGGSVVFSGEYPAWEYSKDTPLQRRMISAYKRLFGAEPQVAAIHAGLECGLFSEKLPGLDCVSFGPELTDIHTPREALSVSSLERTWEFVLEILEKSK